MTLVAYSLVSGRTECFFSPHNDGRNVTDSLTTSRLRELAEEYERCEPLFTVETERLETLPTAFADGTFLWKDAEWVVRWFGRRALSGEPTPAEEAFRENDFEELERAIGGAVEAVGSNVGAVETALDRLTDLAGVDVPVASAYLQFIDPERHVVLDERLWGELADRTSTSALERPYPASVTTDEYTASLAACRRIADQRGVDLVTVYRALWRLSTD